MKFFTDILNVILVVTIFLLTCCKSNQERILDEKKISYPTNIKSWNLDLVKKSFCKVKHKLINKKGTIIGCGVAVSADGYLITSWHFIRESLLDVGNDVYSADQQGFTPKQFNKRKMLYNQILKKYQN